MTNDDTYNGWTNRETWATALHLNNDEGLQEAVTEAVREAAESARERRAEGDLPEWTEQLAASYAGDAAKDYVEGLFDFESFYGSEMPTDSGLLLMLQDIGSLYRVDWTEIGRSFLNES